MMKSVAMFSVSRNIVVDTVDLDVERAEDPDMGVVRLDDDGDYCYVWSSDACPDVDSDADFICNVN